MLRQVQQATSRHARITTQTATQHLLSALTSAMPIVHYPTASQPASEAAEVPVCVPL